MTLFGRPDRMFAEVLLAAGAALGASLAIDSFVPQTYAVIFWEDALKFRGICLWAAFFLLRGGWELVEARGSRSGSERERGGSMVAERVPFTLS